MNVIRRLQKLIILLLLWLLFWPCFLLLITLYLVVINECCSEAHGGCCCVCVHSYFCAQPNCSVEVVLCCVVVGDLVDNISLCGGLPTKLMRGQYTFYKSYLPPLISK